MKKEIWSFLETAREVWNVWEIRGMVLLSLSLQIILAIFGSKRKHTARLWIWVIVWSAYTSADWVAAITLGNMARISQGDSKGNSPKPSDEIQAFWAPFLLLHLGGQDNVTAYSLEDNELWLRHCLAFVVQVGVAFYVFLRSWSNSAIKFIAIPMFKAGIIKYGERISVLKSSNSRQFRDSLLLPPDPGPNIHGDPRAMETKAAMVVPRENIRHNENYLYQAHYLFKRFIYLFAELILGYHERVDSYSIITNTKSAAEAFKLVEVELGFLYDVLYTKALIVYSRMGIFLRCISFFSSVSALISFSLYIDKHVIQTIDISITYILLGGAIVIEVYAFITLIVSDWTVLWLTKLNNRWANSNYFPTQFRQSPLINRRRWSRSMAQHNLISFCLNKKSFNCVGVNEMLEKYQYMTYEPLEPLDDKLQNIVFEQLLEKVDDIKNDRYDIKRCKQFLAQRGDYVLQKWGCLGAFKWSTIDIEFDESLLLWHTATDLCYYSDIKQCESVNNNFSSESKISKCLSNYMLYLLAMRPFMLPKGIGEIRYRDTCAEAVRFFKEKKILDVGHAVKGLLEVDTSIALEQVKGDKSKSVLFYGCKLAKQLQSLQSIENGWSCEQKWEMMSQVLMEMLTYAASHCGWKEHAQQLTSGGEFLTHVCLLMAHLGLSEQYQIQNQELRTEYNFVPSTKTITEACKDLLFVPVYLCYMLFENCLHFCKRLCLYLLLCCYFCCCCVRLIKKVVFDEGFLSD